MIHAVFDLTGCQGIHTPPRDIMNAMHETARNLGATPRSELIEPFQPHGATCVLVLAESHITVSTWPEAGLAHIDIFTCRADVPAHDAIGPLLAFQGDAVAVHGDAGNLAERAHDSLADDEGELVAGK
jgi:S-adenosylmethionine decarboxylase